MSQVRNTETDVIGHMMCYLPFPGFQIREFGHIILLWFSPNSSLIRQTLGMAGLLLRAGFIWSCDMFSDTQIFQVRSPKNFIFSLKMDTTKMLSQKYYQHNKKRKRIYVWLDIFEAGGGPKT